MRGCYIGLDGGGTRTGGALADDNGAVLATARAGPSSTVGLPSPESGAVLRSVRDRLCAAAGLPMSAVVRVGLGLSGVDFADEAAGQHEALARALGLPSDRLVLVNDGIVALWGATAAPAAVIIQHGTGFTAAYRGAPGQERLFDHLDAGRCFDLRCYCVGLNHLGFIHRMASRGGDVTADILERLVEDRRRPPADAEALAWQELCREIGAIPISYLNYFFHRGRIRPAAPAQAGPAQPPPARRCRRH